MNKTILIVALALLIGCEQKQSQTSSTQPAAAGSAGGAGKQITVCLLPKQKNVPYFETCKDGAEVAAKELGIKLIYDGPTDGAAEKAASMIEKWTQQGVDVIAISANDPNVLAPAMKKAREKGVKVVTWDSDGNTDARDFFVNQATAKDIGYALVDTLAKDIATAAGATDPKQAA